MKILLIGDIYAKTGRDAIKRLLPRLLQKYSPDFVVANGENITAGSGLSVKHARQLHMVGIDVFTTGNHIFSRADWPELFNACDFVLRPHNMLPETSPGTGLKVFEKNGLKLAVINLTGRIFIDTTECPLKTFDSLYKRVPDGVPVVVDLHAEATSEKQAFFWYVNGRASVAVGTHTHVQTSDERILPGKTTAILTDLGMSGAINGIIGVDRETVIGRFLNGFSEKFLCAQGPCKIEGLFAELAPDNRPTALERFRLADPTA